MPICHTGSYRSNSSHNTERTSWRFYLAKRRNGSPVRFADFLSFDDVMSDSWSAIVLRRLPAKSAGVLSDVWYRQTTALARRRCQNTTNVLLVLEQRSFISRLLNAADELVFFLTQVLYRHALYLLSTAPMGFVTRYKVSNFDLLLFLS